MYGDDAKFVALAEPKVAKFGSQMRTAFASMASNTGFRSPADELMTRSTSEVADNCSNASLRSRVSRATVASLRSLRRFVFAVLLLRGFADLLLALGCRPIACPCAQDNAS